MRLHARHAAGTGRSQEKEEVKLGRLNHVGVATPSIADAIPYWRDVMGATAIGEPFDLAERLAGEPGEVTEIDESARTTLPAGGHVISGEGAYGNEGFFARLDADGELVWVVYLWDGNPFYEIAVEWPRATFTNNLGNGITVDLTSELYA